MEKSVKLVWLANENEMFEEEWIRMLFKGMRNLSFEVVYDTDRTTIYKNAVIVCNHADHKIPYDDYFQKYEDAKVPFAAIHLSDEILGVSYKFYDYQMCKVVFRNYFHPDHMSNPKVRVFGLGYKTGFASAPSIYEATPWYHWCFVGTIHNQERAKNVAIYEPIIPHFLIAGDTFGKGVDIATYKRIMELSKFSLCLMGQCNVDTFRLYEAMEANSVPIVLGKTPSQDCQPSYWHFMFPWEKDLPFIIVNSWEEGFEKMKEYLYKPLEYMQLRARMQNFWKETKEIWSNMFERELSSSLFCD